MKNIFYSNSFDSNISQVKLVTLTILFFTFSICIGFGQITETYNSSGTFTVPAGVSKITVEVWGAGGGGYNIGSTTNGGGGGAYASSVFTVSPFATYSFIVGNGGGPGVDGEASSFDSGLVVADGGYTSGQKGLASLSSGAVKYDGGDGGGTNPLYGGGGGSSAGTAAAGNPGIILEGGVAPTGGGNGGSLTAGVASGQDGFSPGGGGAGKNATFSPTPQGTPGSGADGMIKITYPSFVASSTACECNNDQTPNNTDGTYTTTLIVKTSDDSPLLNGLSFTIISATGLNNSSGGSIIGSTFNFCNGSSCPAGVSIGQYYLIVQVQPSGSYSAMIDGPDSDDIPEITLSPNNCDPTYPVLPVFPAGLTDLICLRGDSVFTGVANAVYSIDNSLTSINLPYRFFQTGYTISPEENTSGNTILSIDTLIEEVDNNPTFELHLIRQIEGCRVSSYKEFNVYNPVNPILNNTLKDCRSSTGSDTIFLSSMIASGNTGGGKFYIDGNEVVNGKLGVSGPICESVTYTIIDSCGATYSDTKNLQVTYKPEPAFHFATGPDEPASPTCALTDVEVTLVRTSTGPNPVFSASSDNSAYDPVVNSSVPNVTLPAPAPGVIVKYTICLTETNDAATVCPGIATPDPCSVETCKDFILYQDETECGANNPFDNACESYGASPCYAAASPGIKFHCGFIDAEFPPLITSTISTDQTLLFCDGPTLDGSFLVSFLGINFDIGGGSGQMTIGSLPGIGVVCDVLNFQIKIGTWKWRPLALLYNKLGCEKTFAQVIASFFSDILGGDGGGYIAMADTDGDGAFDYLIDKGFFPSLGEVPFSIPNRVKGSGNIIIRAVGGYMNAPNDVCGNFDIKQINLLDLLPIGLIPEVGAIMDAAIKAASCNLPMTQSVEHTVIIPVVNNINAEFVNCNTAGYVFAQTLDCTLPINWSVPAAVDGCNGEPISYAGVTDIVDISHYAGTEIITPVPLDQPGIYQTLGPIPGSILEPGVYEINYTAVSCNGYPTDCTFSVTVTTGDPILECPNDITVSTDIDQCSAEVNGLAPYQGLGCASIINYAYTSPVSGEYIETNSTVTGTHNIPDGHIFELGETIITYIMQVDIDGNGDYNGPDETQECSFSVLVEDNQEPNAKCVDVAVQLDNNGTATVYAAELADQIYIDGGSTDNCMSDLSILLSKNNVEYFPSLDFNCSDKGQNVVNLRVTDGSGNVSYCKANIDVIDFFEGYVLFLDVPQTCFEPFQDTFDFSPYLVIAPPNGTTLSHDNISSLGQFVAGGFGITSFLPDPGSTVDPGTVTEDGIYTIGTGTGFITISYMLFIEDQVEQLSDTTEIFGCFRMVHDIFRIQKLDPVWEGGYMCCDQNPIWLGGASWDGTGEPQIPADMLSLTDIRGSYPGDVYGEWTGEGVSFEDPDGIEYSGDEFFKFDPNGLDGTYTLTYTIGDEPCIFDYSQDILVTCQDLHVEISDFTTCPANWVDEREVLVNLDDNDLVISTTGFAELAIDGAHYGGGPVSDPVADLVDVPVVDGRVVIPGFYAPAVRDKQYEICVTAYQTTPFGCSDIFCYTITVQDLIAPDFQNCPKEPIVVDAPSGWCQSFVNFEYPWVLDNCMDVYAKIEQVDLTGLVSGDLFPVGLTVLSYTATDTVGNQSYCELKIIVNDYDRPPTIACPSDKLQVNDLDQCGAVVNNIEPAWYTDNCPDNLSIIYEVTDSTNAVIGCGFEDASGDFFPVGENTVEYTIFDQPLLLITEIVQDGLMSGVEVTNFGPAAIDLTCATFLLKDINGVIIESYMVPTKNNKSTYGSTPIYPPDSVIWVLPNPNIVQVGETFSYIFNNIPPVGQEMIYGFAFLERIIDEAVINGDVVGEVILRKNVCDHDSEDDFIPATPCDPGSFDLLNPGLPTMTPNGTTTALQNYDPSLDTCSFTVEIIDLEDPTCIKHDSITVPNTLVPVDVLASECMISELTMPPGLVHDVNIHDLMMTIPDAGAVTAYLNSPMGTRIRLFDGICNGQANIDITLDQTIVWIPAPNIVNALCNPMGQGEVYRPEESFKAFYGEEAGGIWTLEIFTTGNISGTLDNWDLEILYQLPYDQENVVLQNIPGQCDTTFTWIHPIFEDNCCEGTVNLIFTFVNDVTGETNADTMVILNNTGTINEQGLSITRVFPVGLTYVQYFLEDQYGNTSVCGFEVSVEDNENPEFLYPCTGRTIYLYPTECYGNMTNPPEAEDNCEIESITFYFEDGTVADITNLPIGVYTLTAVVVDIYGNSQSCDFSVTVVEYIPQSNAMVCNDLVYLSLDASCVAELGADMLLEGDMYRCYENYCITLVDDQGNPHENYFDYSDVGQSFTVTVSECVEGGNSCSTTVEVMEKFEPDIVCPPDTLVACNAVIDPEYLGYVEILNCEPFATISYSDQFIDNGMCGNPRAQIIRTWTVDDQQGNIVSCKQNITISKYELVDLIFPADVLTLECDVVIQNPDATEPVNTGYPTIDGIPINQNLGLCMLSYLWEDEVYHYCGNSYEILRTWKVRDMCGEVSDDNPAVYIQTIKVFDTTPPVIHNCVDLVVGTYAYTCTGTVDIPVPLITDNCNEVSLSILVAGVAVEVQGQYKDGTLKMVAKNMSLGNHEARFIVRDDCGNKSVCYFNILVKDNFPPVATCEQYKQVSLTETGVADVSAEEFDSKSIDNCNDVFFKVKRTDDACPELNGDDSTKPGNQIWFDDKVYYCCDDLASEEAIMTTLRVYEIDPGVGPVDPSREEEGGDLYGHYNDCMTLVEVESKVIPQLICEDKFISCEDNIDPYLNPGLGEPDVFTSCGVYSLEYEDNLNGLDECGIGYINRSWTVFEGDENRGYCTQKIYISPSDPFDPTTIVFPNITSTSCLVDLNTYGQPTFDYNPCNIVTMEMTQADTFRFVDDACYKIYRKWVIIDWCDYLPNTGADSNMDEYLSISGDKRAILDPNNYERDGYYFFIETLMVYDQTAPDIIVADTCYGTTTCVTTPETFVVHARSVEKDDDCGGEYNWKYVIHDLKTWEVVQFSYNNEAYQGSKYVGGVKGKVSKDKLIGTEEASLTILPSLAIGRYRVSWTVNDGCSNTTEAYQYFEIADKKAPTPFLVDISTAYMQNCMVELWAITFDKGACNDNCLASFDNCSEVLYFTYSEILPLIDQTWHLDNHGLFYYDPVTGAKSNREKYLFGEAHSWDPLRKTAGRIYAIDRNGNPPESYYEVAVYVWDEFSLDKSCNDNNFDFAVIQLNLNNQGDDCGDSPFASISGEIEKAETGEKVNNVEVRLDKDHPEYPVYLQSEGNYSFDGVGFGDYNLVANKYDQHQNGVSTLDLLIIQMHLLGIKAMNNVYDIIASDANESGSISAADILTLRRLILSIDDELPKGRSWRFLDENYEFINLLNPWSELADAEKIELTVAGNRDDIDFEGIKIGDVNGTVQMFEDDHPIEGRYTNTIELRVDEMSFEKDELVEVPVYSNDFKDIFGMQFTMHTLDLQFLGIQSGKITIGIQNIGLIDQNLVTFSWNNANGISAAKTDVLFTIIFKANKKGALSNQFSLSSLITNAEAYGNESLDIFNIKLSMSGVKEIVFELFQNVPNPFTEKTEIGFMLPEDSNYELIIHDISGKVLKVINGEGKKFYNAVILENKTLPTGILYYKLKTKHYTASKKMLLIK